MRSAQIAFPLTQSDIGAVSRMQWQYILCPTLPAERSMQRGRDPAIPDDKLGTRRRRQKYQNRSRNLTTETRMLIILQRL
jgi:hypothetical protein